MMDPYGVLPASAHKKYRGPRQQTRSKQEYIDEALGMNATTTSEQLLEILNRFTTLSQLNIIYRRWCFPLMLLKIGKF